MNEKYLIYIDFLGFSELVCRTPHEVDKIYAILDSLNVHNHNLFKTIVFSDTVLIYNLHNPITISDKEYIVMYSIEFVQDLQYRLIGQDIYFRAIVTYGKFNHYNLNNVECYYGNALINAYQTEKTMPSIGLFVDTQSNIYNKIFRTAVFNDNFNFVYTNQSLERFHEKSHGELPFIGSIVNDDFMDLAKEIRYLKDVHHNMRCHKIPSIRQKYLTAWDFYARRYPIMLNILESNLFDLECISSTYDWTTQLKNLEEDIKHYSRLTTARS